MAPKPILVVGGGISGLACAWRLRRNNLPVLLLEASPRFGGVIDSVEQGGFRFDIGPQSFRGEKTMLALIDELGLAAQLCCGDPRAPRYILHHGKLVPAPLGPWGFLSTPLFGWKTKLRIAAEPFGHTRPPEGDESLAAFIRRKFGEDLLDNLAAPAVSGIYAGDPEKLSLRAIFPPLYRFEAEYGSLIRGAIQSQRKRRQQAPTQPAHEDKEGTAGAAPARRRSSGLCNFARGMVTLTDALGAGLGESARRGVEVLEIWRSNGAFQIACRESGASQTFEAAAVVLATPTFQAARLLAGIEPRFAATLARIEYAGVAQVSSGYRLSSISSPAAKKSADLYGFGFLVPRAERRRLLGTVWSSALFPGRTPEGPEKMASFTSFLGGALDPGLCKLGSAEIAQIERADLSAALGIHDPPLTEHVARWERAIPQYNLGHTEVVQALEELCRSQPGVFLVGNYLSGPALPACVTQANRTAEEAARFCSAPDAAPPAQA